MNILVTGANGQLGNEMRTASIGTADRYIFTDVAELDITDAEAVAQMVKNEQINVIVNCAAYTNVDKAESDADMAQLLNATAPQNLATAAKASGATLIHISTDYVFSGEGFIPLQPSDPTSPVSVYGRTKLAGEEAIRLSGCKSIIFRTAWLYSPYGKNFVKTMRQLTADRDELKVVFDQVGSPTYAADLAALIVHIINNKMLDKCGIYHFSNEGVCSWFDFACAIRDLSGNVCNITPCLSHEFPSPVKRPHYSVLDKSLTRSTFGFAIAHWHEALGRCITAIAKG